jgi:hypothetical protein
MIDLRQLLPAVYIDNDKQYIALWDDSDHLKIQSIATLPRKHKI